MKKARGKSRRVGRGRQEIRKTRAWYVVSQDSERLDTHKGVAQVLKLVLQFR